MNYVINVIFCVIFLIISSGVIEAQSQNVTVHHSCNTKTKCSDCIQSPYCAWCLQTNYDKGPRCYHNTQTTECKENYYPENNEKIIKKLPLTKTKSSSSDPSTPDIVQISPQRVSLKLRISE